MNDDSGLLLVDSHSTSIGGVGVSFNFGFGEMMSDELMLEELGRRDGIYSFIFHELEAPKCTSNLNLKFNSSSNENHQPQENQQQQQQQLQQYQKNFSTISCLENSIGCNKNNYSYNCNNNNNNLETKAYNSDSDDYIYDYSKSNINRQRFAVLNDKMLISAAYPKNGEASKRVYIPPTETGYEPDMPMTKIPSKPRMTNSNRFYALNTQKTPSLGFSLPPPRLPPSSFPSLGMPQCSVPELSLCQHPRIRNWYPPNYTARLPPYSSLISSLRSSSQPMQQQPLALNTTAPSTLSSASETMTATSSYLTSMSPISTSLTALPPPLLSLPQHSTPNNCSTIVSSYAPFSAVLNGCTFQYTHPHVVYPAQGHCVMTRNFQLRTPAPPFSHITEPLKRNRRHPLKETEAYKCSLLPPAVVPDLRELFPLDPDVHAPFKEKLQVPEIQSQSEGQNDDHDQEQQQQQEQQQEQQDYHPESENSEDSEIIVTDGPEDFIDHEEIAEEIDFNGSVTDEEEFIDEPLRT